MIIGIAAGWIPADPADIHAPRWVLFAAGLVFVTGGFAAYFSAKPRVVDALIGIFGLAMAGVAIWATFMADPNQIEGGVAFLPRPANLVIARSLFGFGVLLSLGISWVAFRRAFRGPASEQ